MSMKQLSEPLSSQCSLKKREREIGLMSARVKIVVAAINAACLAVTLIFPGTTTPYAVLITIVTVSAWAFTAYEKNSLKNFGLHFYVTIVSIFSMLCIIFGIASRIEPVSAPDKDSISYVFRISSEAFMFGGKEIEYAPIALGTFGIAVILMIAEIFSTAKQKRDLCECPYHTQNQPMTINGYIEQKIGHIK